jgi:hypothetical protein
MVAMHQAVPMRLVAARPPSAPRAAAMHPPGMSPSAMHPAC